MDRKDYDDIIGYAIEREIEAETFYTAIAARVKDRNLKEMFSGFAREESKHQALLRGILKKKEIQTHFHGHLDYRISETVDVPVVSDSMTLADAFALAMKNEQRAMIMYLALAEDATSQEMKAVFSDLAEMEKGHKHLMEKSFADVAYPEAW